LFYPAWRIDWNKWLFHRVESDVDPSGITDVDFVQGCAVMMRRELLETVGCFDERFHLYCEDADLSVRAQRAGWRTVEVEDARVWHDGYGSSGRLSALRIYYGLRNRLLFIAKHASPDRRFALRWRLLFFDAGRSFFKGLRLLTKGRFREGARFLRALNRGLWDGLFGRYHAGPKWLFKRRQRRLE
jgi:hypothetical protein